MGVFNRLQKVFKETFNDTSADIDLEMSREGINTIYGWDSIKHVELMYMIENEFNIEFSLEELQNMKTIRDMLNTIKGHLNVSE